jgi:hypothetical protein
LALLGISLFDHRCGNLPAMSNPALQAPPLNKVAVMGYCARLPVAIDATRLRAEVEALPPDVWGSRAGRVAVMRRARGRSRSKTARC